MDSLPLELHYQILSHVPPSSLPTVRLVSRIFERITFIATFSHLRNWLDYEISHRSITSLAHDAYNRPAVMWSPWASEPDKDVDEVFLGLIWKLFVGHDVLGGISAQTASMSIGNVDDTVQEPHVLLMSLTKATGAISQRTSKDDISVTATNFAEMSGMAEMTENRLKTGQNRYLLYKSYLKKAKDEKPWDFTTTTSVTIVDCTEK